jgi:hypothetical protein
VPVGRTLAGCAVLGLLVVGAALLVRPLIFSLAPPRGDDAVPVIGAGAVIQPTAVPVALVESHGLHGEVRAPDGHVEVTVIVAPAVGGAFSVVNAASPVEPECPVEVVADRLVDCGGRAWMPDGVPLTNGMPPLQRFAMVVEGGVIVVDMTRPLTPAQ